MNFVHERVINCPGSPNDGAIVKADFDARGWNPITDKFDDEWAAVLMPNGIVGCIQKSFLFIPITTDLSKST